jgi:hypothetical protein
MHYRSLLSSTSNSQYPTRCNSAVPQFEPLQGHKTALTPHCGTPARTHQDETFPGRWIDRKVLLHWPPRSPDLTPLDLSTWVYIRSVVYQLPVTEVDNREKRITCVIMLTCSSEHDSNNVDCTLSGWSHWAVTLR